MSPAGLFLIAVGVWGLCQVLGGNALGRLGITGAPTDPGTDKTAPDIIAPGPFTGVPLPDQYR